MPDDPILLADLAAPTLDLSFNGIKVENKEDACKRLGRSTDHGDAVVMAWSAGTKQIAPYAFWSAEMGRPRTMQSNRKPVVILRRPRWR